jgi:hypothetical protein
VSQTLVPAGPVEVASQLAVMRALEAAGKRARLPRHVQARARDCNGCEVHLQVRLAHSDDECDRLLAGVWDHLRIVFDSHDLMPPTVLDTLVRALDLWVRDLIVKQQRPDWDTMRQVIALAYE